MSSGEETTGSSALTAGLDDDHEASAVTIKHESSSASSGNMLTGVSMMVSSDGSGGASSVGGGIVSDHHPPTLCGGCGFKITDRFYLVAVERAWHSDCLRCGECRRPLDTALSCFSRQSRIYCRDDYYRYALHSVTFYIVENVVCDKIPCSDSGHFFLLLRIQAP